LKYVSSWYDFNNETACDFEILKNDEIPIETYRIIKYIYDNKYLTKSKVFVLNISKIVSL